MLFVETSVFTRQVTRTLHADSYRALQLELSDDPRRGALIPASGGLRKLRWEGSGRGKRGGTRVIYYWAAREQIVLLLMLYPKGEQEDLTPEQVKVLRRVVREAFG